MFRLSYFLAAASCAAAILLLSGCGGGEPFSHVKVTGKVTYEDDTLIPAERITIGFTPEAKEIDPATFPRPGFAEVNEKDGTFDTVTSRDYGDGLVVGTHKVKVETFDANNNPSPLVPEEVKDPLQSKIVVDTAKTPFHIKVPKPKSAPKK